MAFSSGFLVAPPPAHSLTPSLFAMLKVFRWYKYGLSFIYVWLFVVLEFWNFTCFHTSRKYSFRLLLCGFLDVTHWNVVKFVWNFDQWCNATYCIRHMTVFILFLKNTWNWAKKNNFLAYFERFVVYAFLRPVSYTPIFCQIKCLMEVHNCGKFHYGSICGCQVINFQMFSWRCSIHEMAPFGGFLGPFSPKWTF